MNRLSDFEELVRKCKPTHFLFMSDDQEGEDPFGPCNIRIDLCDIFVDVASQSVFAKSNSGFMRINRIVGVEVEENHGLMGRVVTFRCGGKPWGTKEYTYKVLVA